MSRASRKILADALALPEDERVELAAEIIASIDGEPDPDWESAWAAELDRRVEAAAKRDEPAPEWAEVRARILSRLGK